MLMYIHGFGGCGLGKKASILRKKYKEKLLAPSLSYVPTLAVDTLEQIIELLLQKNKNVHLIGSSAGGYISIYLATKYSLKAVLINPAIYPYKLTQMIGNAKNYFDDSTFQCTQEHLENMKKYEITQIKDETNFMLLLAKNDEILNYKEALEKFSKSCAIVEETGGHEFVQFEKKLQEIEQFFKINIQKT